MMRLPDIQPWQRGGLHMMSGNFRTAEVKCDADYGAGFLLSLAHEHGRCHSAWRGQTGFQISMGPAHSEIL